MRLPLQLPTETWASASWEEYLQVQNDPSYLNAKLYFFEGQIRIEMNAAVGANHARDNAIIPLVINLFSLTKGIPLNSLINGSYEKKGSQGCQPDIAYYIGANAYKVPSGRSIVNLETQPAPDLVIEIADSTILDDLSRKRKLYESLAIQEYWVVDVGKAEVTAFTIEKTGSYPVLESAVLPGLSLALLAEALQRSRNIDQTALSQWLLAEFRGQSL